MAVNQKIFINPRFATLVGQVEFTATAKSLIDFFTATNTTADPQTISIHHVPPGEQAQDSNKVLSMIDLDPNETFRGAGMIGRQLDTGDRLFVQCSALDAICITCNGREIV